MPFLLAVTIIFIGITGIIYTILSILSYSKSEIRKDKKTLESQVQKLIKEVDSLKNSNKELQDRLQNIEIIVANDSFEPEQKLLEKQKQETLIEQLKAVLSELEKKKR